MGLRGVRAKSFAGPGVHRWLLGQLTRASCLALKATAFPPQQFVELFSILARAKVCGGHARSPTTRSVTSASRADISPPMRSLPKPGLAPCPEARKSHDRLTVGMPLARENVQPPLWSTRHRMRPRSVIQVWMSSATWSEFVSIISIWPLPVIPLSGSETQSTLPPMAASALW